MKTILKLIFLFLLFNQNLFASWKDNFILTVNIANDGDTFTIPTHSDYDYNYNIACGDDDDTTYTSQTGDVTCSYEDSGTYDIEISDGVGDGSGFPAIYFEESEDKTKLIGITQWGTGKWETMESAFEGCSNLNDEYDADDIPDLSLVKDMSYMFADATAFNQDIGDWNVSSVEDMSYMFSNATDFNQDIGDWDVSAVDSMNEMFDEVTLSQTHYDSLLEGWSQLSLEDDVQFSAGSSKYCAIDAKEILEETYDWSVDDRGEANNCSVDALDTIISYVEDNNNATPTTSDYSHLEVTGVSSDNLDTVNATLANYTAEDVNTTEKIQSIVDFTSSNNFIITVTVEDNDTFTIPTHSNYNYNYHVDCENDGLNDYTSQTEDVTCSYDTAGKYQIRISDATGLQSGFPAIYFIDSEEGERLTGINQWGTSKWETMEGAFYGCANLNDDYNATDVPDLSLVTKMEAMFSGATSFNQAIGDWNVSSVEDMTYMFGEATSFNQELEDWDVSSVTNMSSMFYKATSFNQKLGDWNVSSVKYMPYMFKGITLSQTNYDAILEGWNQLNLTDDITFSAGDSTYCAEDAREVFTDTYAWTITDGGKDSSCSEVALETISAYADDNTSTVPSIEDYNIIGVNGVNSENLDLVNSAISNAGSDGADTTAEIQALIDIILSYDFIITITTTDDNDTFTIPTHSDYNYNYNVDCEDDGTNEFTSQTGDVTCSYESAGTYQIRISDASGVSSGFPAIYFNDTGDKKLITGINQWGTGKWESMENAFYGCYNLNDDYTATDVPDLSSVTDMSAMFREATNFNQDIGDWDVSSVEEMSDMFYAVTNFNQNLGDWNVSSLKSMYYIFNGVTFSQKNYDSLLEGWSQLNLQSNQSFFAGSGTYCAEDAREILTDTYGWTVIDGGKDSNCSEYALDVISNYADDSNSSTPTTSDYSNIGVTGVNSENLDAINLAISNAGTDGADTAEEIQALIDIILSYDFIITITTTDDNDTFTIPTNSDYSYNYHVDCTDDGTNDYTYQTGDVTCSYESNGTYQIRISDAEGNNTGFPAIYFNNSGDKELLTGVNQWGTGIWQSMERAFRGCSNLNDDYTATDVPNLSSVKDMSRMFEGATDFNQSIGDWDVSSVEDMQSMFYNATNFNQELGDWNVSSVENMGFIFYNATAFNQAIGGWDVSSVQYMYFMFYNAIAFNQDIRDWDVSSVVEMASMFRNATTFNQELGDWDVSSVQSMNDMFEGVTLSQTNYDLLLEGWSELTLENGVYFSAGDSTYCAEDARTVLTDTYSWTITDGGLDDNCTTYEAIKTITDYAEDNTSTTPTVDDYTNAGITGVTSENLDEVNDAISNAGSEGADTTIEVQAIINEITSSTIEDININDAPSIETNFEDITSSDPRTIVLVQDNEEVNSTVSVDKNLSEVSVDGNTVSVDVNNSEIEVTLNEDGSINANILLTDGSTSTLEVNTSQNQVNIDSAGSIRVRTTSNDTNIEIALNADGTGNYTMEYNGLTTSIISNLAGTSISVDENGNVVLSVSLEQNGFLYTVTITTDTEGKSSTELRKTDVGTEDEDVFTILEKGASFENGSSLEVLMLNDLLYMQVTTTLDNTLTIN